MTKLYWTWKMPIFMWAIVYANIFARVECAKVVDGEKRGQWWH
jgi:hypothetical protein